MRAFFDLGGAVAFHCMLWHFVSGSYWKQHDSSPVITPKSCFLRSTDESDQNKHQATAASGHQTKFVAPSLLKLSSFPNLQSKSFSQFLCLNLVPLPSFVDLIVCQNEPISALFHIFICPVSFRASSSFVVFHVFPTLSKPFMPLKDTRLHLAARNTFLLQLQTNFKSFPNNYRVSRDCRLTGYFIINKWTCYLLFELPFFLLVLLEPRIVKFLCCRPDCIPSPGFYTCSASSVSESRILVSPFSVRILISNDFLHRISVNLLTCCFTNPIQRF
jgi:hypothetical protein